MAVDFAIFQKSWHEGCKLVFGEVIAIIDKDALIRQSKNGLRIGNEHIGQLRRPWLSRRCGNDAVVDVLVVRHHGDLNLDALFDTNRVVENIDEIVERRIRLATVDVPDGDGGRLVALRADAAGTEQQPAGERQRKNDADYPSHTHNPPFISLLAADRKKIESHGSLCQQNIVRASTFRTEVSDLGLGFRNHVIELRLCIRQRHYSI